MDHDVPAAMLATVLVGAPRNARRAGGAAAGRSRARAAPAIRVGDNWRRHYDSLRLYRPAKFNALPGWPVPFDPWTYLSKDQIADYLEAYADRFDLPVITGVKVDRLRRSGETYLVRAGAHRFEADNVVVASGTL